MNNLPEAPKQEIPARWTPHATVATIVEKDGKFLLVEERRLINKQGDYGIVFNQPAGSRVKTSGRSLFIDRTL
jgi:hypothetical protein